MSLYYQRTVSIKFDESTCEKIIKKTRLFPHNGGSPKLMEELNRLVPSLVESLKGKAIPGTRAIRGEITNAFAATDRILWRIGFPPKGASRSARMPTWAPAIAKLSDRPYGPADEQIDIRMNRLVEDIFWLRDELDALKAHYGHNSEGFRRYRVKQFCFDTLKIYCSLFDRPVRRSTGRDGQTPAGPVIRFLTSIFEELRRILQTDLSISLLEDLALAPSDDTLRSWTIEFIRRYQ